MSRLGMVLAGVVAGSLLPVPTLGDAAKAGGKSARPSAPVAAAPAASSAPAMPPRVSPYVIAARRHAQAASGAGHAPAIPPTMRRTRQAIGERVRP